MMPVLFYGDPHRKFDPLFDAVARHRPEHVVIAGDLDLQRPFRDVLAPVIAQGVQCWWIPGNHDCTDAAQYDFLFEDYPEGNLCNRAVSMPCRDGTLSVAGLGGIYRGRVWYPISGKKPVFMRREDFLAVTRPHVRWRKGLPLRQRDTIFPEDHTILAAQKCDILVSHEAPSCHEYGTAEIDRLGQEMGAKLFVHGHMHHSYRGYSKFGTPVRGLDGAEVFIVSPQDLAA
ncbi:hypothetical protein THS27_07240 [Thalassospira sp. MCCC 1A01428]|nr:hypothetical protein THS27_07240 [Thalassospira sp. MCCC 1A01428]